MSCVDTDRPISQEPSQGPVSEEQSGGGRRNAEITGVETKSMELNFGLLSLKAQADLTSRLAVLQSTVPTDRGKQTTIHYM